MANDQTVDTADTTADTSTVDTTVTTTDDKSTTTDTTTVDTSTTTDDKSTTVDDKSTTVDDKSTTTDDTDKSKEGDKSWSDTVARISKGDDKIAKRLGRYDSVDSLAEALIQAQNKIASGALKSALPENATEEQLAAWRAENGVPAAPEDYEIALEGDYVIGEADQPIVEEFVKEAHGLNLGNKEVNKVLSWYFAKEEAMVEARNAEDARQRDETTELLRETWGEDYKANKNAIVGLLDAAPPGVKDLMLGARLSDGTPLASHPDTLRWMAQMAREINPAATVVPGSTTNSAQAIETELEQLTKKMGDLESDYWKGPSAEKNQARYRDLLTAQEKLKARG
jgi:hypothetical protein